MARLQTRMQFIPDDSFFIRRGNLISSGCSLGEMVWLGWLIDAIITTCDDDAKQPAEAQPSSPNHVQVKLHSQSRADLSSLDK